MESLRGVLARRLACNADAWKECSKKQRSAEKCFLGKCKRILQETPEHSSTAAETLRLHVLGIIVAAVNTTYKYLK